MAESAIASDLAHELRIPESPEELAEILESLPDLMETLVTGINGLAEYMSEKGLHEDVTGIANDLPGIMASGKDSADQLWEAFSDHYDFWLHR